MNRYKGSFNEAFAQAKRNGDQTFEWYNPKTGTVQQFGTQMKSPNAKATSVYANRGDNNRNIREKIGTRQGTVTDRYYITKDKQSGMYGAVDKSTGQVLKGFNSFDEAQKWMNSDDFKKNAGNEIGVTATYTKISPNQSGFIPVKTQDKNNPDGSTRVYKNYTTGEYYLTDMYGNVQGRTLDPSVVQKGNWGFVKSDGGGQRDLRMAQTADLAHQANRNEANQLTRQEYERKVGTEYDDRVAGAKRFVVGSNMVNGMINIPNNAITGLFRIAENIKAGTPEKYSWKDYVNSFTMDGMANGNTSIGLGSLVADRVDNLNPLVQMGLDIVNPMSAVAMVKAGPKYTPGRTVEKGGYTERLPMHEIERSTQLVGEDPYTSQSHAMVRNNGRYAGRFSTGDRPMYIVDEEPIYAKPSTDISFVDPQARTFRAQNIIENGTRTQNQNYVMARVERPQVSTTKPRYRTTSPKVTPTEFDKIPGYRTQIVETPKESFVDVRVPGKQVYEMPKLTFENDLPILRTGITTKVEPKKSNRKRKERPKEFYYDGQESPTSEYMRTGVVPASNGQPYLKTGERNPNTVVVLDSNSKEVPTLSQPVVGGNRDNKAYEILQTVPVNRRGGKLIPRR